MSLVVPDASVILKWVLPSEKEDHCQQALDIRDAAIRGEVTLMVPSLWIFEVGNTLSRRFPKDCSRLLETLLQFGLNEPTWDSTWLDKCLYLTQRYKVTFYDAAYHGLALAYGGIFVTADQEYVTKTRSAGSTQALSAWS